MNEEVTIYTISFPTEEVEILAVPGDKGYSGFSGYSGAGIGSPLPIYANNAAALAGGLKVGSFYRTNSDPDFVCVVH